MDKITIRECTIDEYIEILELQAEKDFFELCTEQILRKYNTNDKLKMIK